MSHNTKLSKYEKPKPDPAENFQSPKDFGGKEHLKF